MKLLPLLFLSVLFYSCTSKNGKQTTTDTLKTNPSTITKINNGVQGNSIAEFEHQFYLEIDEIHTGKTYINKSNLNAFYRVLVIPEEENIMLIAENISFGDEGGNFKLIKLSRITDDNSVLPKFGLSSADSLKFIDSVTIEGYFNNKKMAINLDKLKQYHPE